MLVIVEEIGMRWLVILSLCLALWTCFSRPALAFTASQQGNRLLIDGAPVALTFARGCTSIQELPAYCALGFNTLLVTVDSPGERRLATLDKLMSAAEERGLLILVELSAGAWSDGQYANLHDDDYLRNAADYLDSVMPALKDHPNIVGWIVSTVDERQTISALGAFPDFLERKYGTVDLLNDAWDEKDDTGSVKASARIHSFSELAGLLPAQVYSKGASQVVRDRILEDLNEYDVLVKARDDDFRRYLQARYKTIAGLKTQWQPNPRWKIDNWSDISVDSIRQANREKPYAYPAPILDLARYQTVVGPAVMNWWAAAVKAHDGKRLLFAGAQHRYRTLITTPRTYNGVLVECYPGYGEGDLASQNPHALDMARRGNQFIVLAGLLARQDIGAENTINAMFEAALHGAAGVCLEEWSSLRASSLQAAVNAGLLDLWRRSLFNRSPAPTVAVVYSPYAPGVRGLYGYLDSFLHPGPGMMFFTFRTGTSCGQIDYLSAEDLGRVSLSRYHTIILPTVLDLPDASQAALQRFVQNGGNALADMSVGTMQATHDLAALPDKMTQTFGVMQVRHFEKAPLNLEVYQADNRFPDLLQGMRSNGMANGFMMSMISKATPMANTQLLFSTAATAAFQKPQIKMRKPLEIKPMRGMFISQQGQGGYAIYAPFPLYQYWTPKNMLFTEFHMDLFSTGSTVFLQNPDEFIPTLAEVAAFADGSVYTWTKDQTKPVVRVLNPRRLAYATLNGSCEINGRITTFRYEKGGFQVADPLPIAVSLGPMPLQFTAVRVNSFELVFDIGVQQEEADGQPVILKVGDGMYPVAAGSKHTLSVTVGGKTASSDVQADADGTLTLTLPSTGRVRLVSDEPLPVQNDDDIVLDPAPGTEKTTTK